MSSHFTEEKSQFVLPDYDYAKVRDACDRQAASSPLALLPREEASKVRF